MSLERGADDIGALLKALAQTRDEAERAKAAKAEFLALMSHEMLTPLNGVLGMLWMLLESKLDTEQKEWAETAKISADRLLTVVNDLLDFAKMETDHLELERIPYDLAAVIGGIANALKKQAAEKALVFRTEIAPDVPIGLIGDPARLRQILFNLLDNAIKFTERGVVSLRVSCAESGATLRFEVSDTGAGIADEDRTKLFTKFTQVDSSNTRRHGGIGLGLVICQRLVTMMGGAIGVETKLGQGSTFWFNVPCEPAPTSQAPVFMADLTRTRIVITGTSPDDRRHLVEGLKGSGANAELVPSTKAALEHLSAIIAAGDRFPVVIYAADALAADAVEFARGVRAERHLDGCSLVLLVKSGLRGDAARAKDLGYAAYLSRPLDADLLLRCLRQIESTTDSARAQPANLITVHSLREAIGRVPVVLIAEDHPVNQKLIAAMMQQLGCSAVIVGDGAAAVERVKAGGIDVVLMDIQMPVMDGLSATRAIRELGDANAWVPIIAITAHAMAGDEENFKAAGIDDFVPKPIDAGRLKGALQHWTRSKPELRSATALLGQGADDQTPVLDHAALVNLERTLGKPGMVELVALYLKTTERQLDELERAIGAGDRARIGAELHDLKSASGNLGVGRLAAQARALEVAVETGSIDAIRELMAPLRAQFDATREAFGGRYKA